MDTPEAGSQPNADPVVTPAGGAISRGDEEPRRELSSSALIPAARVLARASWWAAPAVVLTVLSWSGVYRVPYSGLDASWTAGLQMAVDQHLNFGTQVIWTYGPLGFLTVGPIPWNLHLAELSYVYILVLRLCLTAAVYRRLRQTFGRIVAFLACLVIVSVATPLIGELALLVLAAGWALDATLSDRWLTVIAAAFGAFAAVEMLTKVSIGFTAVVIAAAIAGVLPGRRRNQIAAAVAAFAITILMLWTVLDQALSALPHYLLASIQVSVGYKAAMGLGGHAEKLEYLAALLGLIAGLCAGFRVTRGRSARQRYALIGVWCLFWYSAFNEGFVRHDSGHAALFFSSLLIGWFCFRWERRDRVIPLVAATAFVVWVLLVHSVGLTTDLQPVSNLRTFFSNAGEALSPSQQVANQVLGRFLIKFTEPLMPSSLSLLSGRTVAAYPEEIAQIWAYGLKWDPIPVLQSYSAYTSSLDADDATFLAGRDAPERIIYREAPEIDGRFLNFDQSQTTRTILCHYQLLQATTNYSVLGRIANRCTRPARLLETVRADWGVGVPVPSTPRGRWLVYVRIDATWNTELERLESLLLKAPARWIQLDSGPIYRLVTGTAADGLLLDAPAGVDYPAPFNLAPGAKELTVLRSAVVAIGGPPVTYSFYEQRIN